MRHMSAKVEFENSFALIRVQGVPARYEGVSRGNTVESVPLDAFFAHLFGRSKR